MTSKKEAAEVAAEKDGVSALGRKAYGDATAALREAHRGEFDDLLDEAYDALGLVSPRVKRVAREKAAAEAKAAAAEKRAKRKADRLEALRAELAALEADPLF